MKKEHILILIIIVGLGWFIWKSRQNKEEEGEEEEKGLETPKAKKIEVNKPVAGESPHVVVSNVGIIPQNNLPPSEPVKKTVEETYNFPKEESKPVTPNETPSGAVIQNETVVDYLPKPSTDLTTYLENSKPTIVVTGVKKIAEIGNNEIGVKGRRGVRNAISNAKANENKITVPLLMPNI